MIPRRAHYFTQANQLWFHFEGRTYVIPLNQKKYKGAVNDGDVSDSGNICSPMPGKVLKVNFQEGDRVEKNVTVCVLEAMKMEYALKAPRSGVVKKIYKKPGDQVALDDKIVEIEEAK